MVPGDEFAGGIETRFDVMRRHRPELAARHIVLASPDQLDRLADRLGEPHRIDNHFLLAAATITSTEEMLMQGDTGSVYPQETGDLVVQVGGALGPGPDLDGLAVGTDGRGGVHRLHLGVVQIAGAVFTPVDLDSAAHRRLGVANAFIRHAFAALVAPDGGELLERPLAVVMRAWSIAPGDLEPVLGALGRLDAGSNHADAFGQLYDICDARYLPRACFVHHLGTAARIGGLQHRGINHAGDLS